MFCFLTATYGQTNNGILKLNTINNFINDFNASAGQSGNTMSLQLPSAKVIDVRLTENKSEGEEIMIYGEVNGAKSSLFLLSGTKDNLKGHIIIDFKEAYEISTNVPANEVLINQADINKFICVTPGLTGSTSNSHSNQANQVTSAITTQAAYSSLPGATVVLYLDFDGEYVNDPYWNSQMGGAQQCTGPNYSAAMIKQIWATISEDYRPFNINVTTDRAVYDATASANKEMVVYTSTWNPTGSTGGISSVGGFASNDTHICWVFFNHLNNDVNDQSETGSHESGHTWGLLHDSSPAGTYYPGQGNWGPIMGNNYQSNARVVWQWSKGEYKNATINGNTSGTNTQDDVDVIQKNPNVGYRTDEDANTTASARDIVQETNGIVLGSKNNGVITTRTDKDYFKFTTAGGVVTFNFQSGTNDFSSEPDLDIQARLLNSSGTELAIHDSVVGMAAKISKSVPAGTYYLEVDGVGYLDPLTTGYSDYSSIGYYEISGSFPQSSTGIEELAEGEKVIVYPNPIEENTTIKFNLIEKQKVELKIYNVMGQEAAFIFSKELNSGEYEYPITNKNKMVPGVYLVKLTVGDQNFTRKIIVQ